MDETLSQIKEAILYLMRKVRDFDDWVFNHPMFQPQPKTVHHTRVVHHYVVFEEEELKPKNKWEEYYHHLIKGF